MEKYSEIKQNNTSQPKEESISSSIGIILENKYKIQRQIGKGGMSIVYLAWDLRLRKWWAIKEIRKNIMQYNTGMVVNSLVREVNWMKRLDHPCLPHIVDIIDTEEMIYLVMDYIEGKSLERILMEQGAQSEKKVVEWAKQICAALSYLHTQTPPIIYRDMKPANIMLKPDGNVKIIDFGIAREYKEEKRMDTSILGTKGYAPPEQHGFRQTDTRSDIYALGMTMHHLLTGVDPRTPDYRYRSIQNWNLNLSGSLSRVIDKCTAFAPENRYQTCTELMYALEHYEQEEEVPKSQKSKILFWRACIVGTILMIAMGMAGMKLNELEKQREYEKKISISSSMSYEEKVQNYLAAIDLFETDTRAYLKLLEAYQENQLFGEEQSTQFSSKYNENKDYFLQDEDYFNLVYEAAITYFYLYSGGDNSFRTRVLKAYPYFEWIVNSGQQEYPYFNLAQSYCIVGDFYKEYIVSDVRVKEPTKETYEELLTSLQMCMDDMKNYDYEDSAYVKLTMYREIANILNNNRKGLAIVQVEKREVLSLLQEIWERAQSFVVTQANSIEIQSAIMESYEEYVENIERAYKNTEERRAQDG